MFVKEALTNSKFNIIYVNHLIFLPCKCSSGASHGGLIHEYGAPHGGRASSRLSLSRAGIFSPAAVAWVCKYCRPHSIPADTFRPPLRKAGKHENTLDIIYKWYLITVEV
jgi:hypothetical protein